MKYLVTVALIVLMACNSGNNENDGYTNEDLPNPEKVQPPSDAIPEDMTIKNDSVVLPDSNAVNRITDSTRDTLNQ